LPQNILHTEADRHIIKIRIAGCAPVNQGGEIMELNENIQKVCDDIVRLFKPEKVILFHVKRSLDGVIRSFKICVIIDTDDKNSTEKHLYLDVDSDIPFDVLVYTPAEWKGLLAEKSSFACRIIREGKYIHGD
jgi:hypothetical protein